MTAKATRLRIVESSSLDQRKGLRHPAIIARASVRQLSRDPADAMLLDLSIYGCRLTSSLDPIVGERLWMRLSGSLPIAATVIWVTDGVIGCRFDRPIDHNLLKSLILSAA